MRNQVVGIVVATMAVALVWPAAARAQDARNGSCKPVFDAMLKETMTPHHLVTNTGTRTGEAIATTDANYVLVNGSWRKSPMSPKDQLAQQEENIRDTTVASCKVIGDEVVDGKAAIVYQAHYEQKDMGASDAKIWLSKATGLPLRTDVSLQAGEKASIVTKFDYDNIKAPIVK